MFLSDVVFQTITQHGLIPPGTILVVAVSGGADSVTLLHVLLTLRERLACRLHIATLDHQLRGETSAEDVRFVQSLAVQWELPITTGRTDVRQLASEKGIGIEAAAREARYAFLASTARQVGAAHIATAHQADDQAETILLHLLRGTGVQGLVGMRFQSPVPGNPDLTVIRPLLRVSRADIDAYCQQVPLTPRQDASNQDTQFLRNYIRWETIPHLEKRNPSVKRRLNQLADILSVENDYLEQQLQAELASQILFEAGRILVNRAAFHDLHPALQRRYLLWAVRQLHTEAEVGYLSVLEAVDVAAHGQTGAQAVLGHGIRLRVVYDSLVVEHENAPVETSHLFLLDSEDEIPVSIPGVTAVGQWQFRAMLEPEAGIQARLMLPAGSAVSLRTRRRGDWFAPLGLNGHTQKLTEWMVDHKVPRAMRSQIPLLVVNGEIAAILHFSPWTISEYFKVRDGDRAMYYFSIHKGMV